MTDWLKRGGCGAVEVSSWAAASNTANVPPSGETFDWRTHFSQSDVRVERIFGNDPTPESAALNIMAKAQNERPPLALKLMGDTALETYKVRVSTDAERIKEFARKSLNSATKTALRAFQRSDRFAAWLEEEGLDQETVTQWKAVKAENLVRTVFDRGGVVGVVVLLMEMVDALEGVPLTKLVNGGGRIVRAHAYDPRSPNSGPADVLSM